jgi:hypothetical protein
MGWSFWAGILIGFVLSVGLTIGFWLATTKWLVPQLTAGHPMRLLESHHGDGTWSYRLEVGNEGRRHAVDVEFSCTLFSEGWAGDPDGLIATVALPVSTGRIGVMPAHRTRRNRRHPLTFVGPRVVTFTTKLTDFQARKLGERGQAARDGKIRLGELMGLGRGSLLSLTIYAYDNFSGARTVFTRAFEVNRDGVSVQLPFVSH